MCCAGLFPSTTYSSTSKIPFSHSKDNLEHFFCFRM